MIRHFELFGGIGGFSQAIADYYPEDFETTGYCDIDQDARLVYHSQFPQHPKFRDIRHLYLKEGTNDIITCTFPCTGTSVAGERAGLHHEESGLWREGLRILCQAKPRYFVWEQPLGFADRGLRTVIGATRMAGYQEEIIRISASDLGAGHQRTRIFVVAYPDHWQRHDQKRWKNEARAEAEKVRNRAQWLSVKLAGIRDDYGLSVGLVRGDVFDEIAPEKYLVPNGQRHRPTARRLAAKAVTPPQAAIALTFVKFLEDTCYANEA